MTCPNRLRDLRRQKHWTQIHMQSDISLHIDQSDYSKYERGIRKIPLYIACRLADKFDVSLDYMTYATDVRDHYAFRANTSAKSYIDVASSEEICRRMTGNRLLEMRCKARSTQTYISSLIGADQSNYAKIEKRTSPSLSGKLQGPRCLSPNQHGLSRRKNRYQRSLP